MKKALQIICVLFLVTSCTSELDLQEPGVYVLSTNQLFENNGLVYEVDTIKPISGTVVDYYNNKQIKYRLNYKFGQLDGLQERYHYTGQLTSKRNYKDGLRHGTQETFLPDGSREFKGNSKEGELEGLQYSYSNDEVSTVYNCYKVTDTRYTDSGEHKCFDYKE